jgi:hypothetical protein
MALPIETMDRELLTEKRQRRALNIQLLKADTQEKIVQVKMAQLLHGALSCAEDGLLLTLSAEPAADKRQRWLDAVKIQRKAVLEMTELLVQIRMQVELGAAAVTKIFHTAAGYEELSEDQQKLLKKFTAAKEKEEKEQAERKQKQQEQELLAQQIYFYSGGVRP